MRPAWFRWLFYERLTKLILGFFGIVPFFVGLVVAIRNIIVKKNITSQSWLAKITTFFYKPFSSKTISSAYVYVLVSCASALAYLIVVAGGNVRHDYYQVVLIPLIAIIYALGTVWLLKKKSVFPKALLIITTALGLIISANTIRGYYQINHWAIVRAGEAVNRLTPPEALVIAPYMGDTAFLYQTNRSGWPLGFYIDEKIKEGADYYVTVNYDDEARELEAKYETIEKTDEYLILKF